MNRKTCKGVLLLTMSAIVMTLACVEILLRVSGYIPYYLDAQAFVASRNPQILYELRPGFHGLYAGVPVSINARGFRGHELVTNNGAGVAATRIMTIGDSITFGQGVQDDATLAEQIKKHYNKYQETQSVEVYNLGVPGYDTCQEYWLYNERGGEINPNLVLLIYYENDTDPPVFRVDNGRVLSPDIQSGMLQNP